MARETIEQFVRRYLDEELYAERIAHGKLYVRPHVSRHFEWGHVLSVLYATNKRTWVLGYIVRNKHTQEREAWLSFSVGEADPGVTYTQRKVVHAILDHPAFGVERVFYMPHRLLETDCLRNDSAVAGTLVSWLRHTLSRRMQKPEAHKRRSLIVTERDLRTYAHNLVRNATHGLPESALRPDAADMVLEARSVLAVCDEVRVALDARRDADAFTLFRSLYMLSRT